MPAEYIIRYLGDETTELVEGQKPHRQELNNIVKQVTERCDSDNRKELIRNFFDFMVDPATEGTRKKYAEYKRAEAIKKPVLVKGEDGEYVRRFPVVLSKEGKVEYKQKRVGYAGVIFNYTGKNLPNGDPEYTTRCTFDQWQKIRNQQTQLGKLPMYLEIEEVKSKNDEALESLIKSAAAQAVEKALEPVPVEKNIETEPPPVKKSSRGKE